MVRLLSRPALACLSLLAAAGMFATLPGAAQTVEPAQYRVYLPLVMVDALFISYPTPPLATAVPAPTAIPTAAPGVAPSVTLKIKDGVQVVQIDGPGLVLDLPQIAAASSGLTLTRAPLLTDEGGGVWRLNTALRIGPNVRLDIGGDAAWLKIRSDTSPQTNTIDAASYAYLETVDGMIVISGTKVTSWDTLTPGFDSTPKNGRAFVRAVGAARMDVISSEIAYLGSPQGSGSYGLSWRDERTFNGTLLAGVTGSVIDSDIHHLYYGFFSYAASGMLIKGNRFHHNDSYGFDPHDFSHGFVVEDNAAYENGNHGFIISRGCHNFIFRRNRSYANRYTADERPFRAHGFMVDPGGIDSTGGPYTPSYNNLIEFNHAYDNQGYGLRLLDAYSTTVRNNTFGNNLRGVTIERDSFDNVLLTNIITGNVEDGVQLVDDAHHNHILANTIAGNGQEGISFGDKAQINTVALNTISGGNYGIRGSSETRLNVWTRNSIFGVVSATVYLADGGNRNMLAPYDLSLTGLVLTGKARPGATIEVFSDDGGHARTFEGSTLTDVAGNWRFTANSAWRGAKLTAMAITVDRGASEFSTSVPVR